MAGLRVQHHDLCVREALTHDLVKLIGVQVRQLRIEQQHSVIRSMLAEQLQSFRASAGMEHIPARRAQFFLELFAEPAIRADNEYINR